MKKNTRFAFNAYLQQLARLNGVAVEELSSKFTVEPSVQQTLEDQIQQSAAFLTLINVTPVTEQYRYTLNVVIEDFSGDQNLLMAPVLLWLRDNQPDAINNPALREKLFTFEVDILRNDVCDISLNLQLTERVLVSTDGSVSSVEAVAEPDEPEEMWTVKRG